MIEVWERRPPPFTLFFVGDVMSIKDVQDGSRHLAAMENLPGFEGMIGACPAMQKLFRTIEQVAETDVSVMIFGESGTGKEMAARALHRRSRRSGGPMVPINMAAIPRELAESILFGHEKGAFTGADRAQAGVCEQAHNGTLFLDEIGELPLDLQPKLLRFLQERRFRRIGGLTEYSADVRIISATNRDPEREVRAGRLREDLFFRLNVVPIHMPPLRNRMEDIPILALFAVRLFAQRHERTFRAIDPQAIRRLMAYHWPGNIRQLFNVIERAVVLHNGPTLTAEMLMADTWFKDVASDDPSPPSEGPGWPMGSDDMVMPLNELERRAIEQAMRQCQGSASEAARRLNISQATIYRKLKAHGLDDLRRRPMAMEGQTARFISLAGHPQPDSLCLKQPESPEVPV